MPGQWIDLTTQTADTEEAIFEMTGLTGGTEYDVRFAKMSDFSDAATGNFETLAAPVRALDSVVVNGAPIEGWNYVTDDNFTLTVTFAAFTGSVNITATAVDAGAVVVVDPTTVSDLRHGDTTTITITNTVLGGSRTFTLTINVIAFQLADFDTGNQPQDIYPVGSSFLVGHSDGVTPPRLYNNQGMQTQSFSSNRPTISANRINTGLDSGVFTEAFINSSGIRLRIRDFDPTTGFSNVGGISSTLAESGMSYPAIFCNGRIFVRNWNGSTYKFKAFTYSGNTPTRDSTGDFTVYTGSFMNVVDMVWTGSNYLVLISQGNTREFIGFTDSFARDTTLDFDLTEDNANPQGAAYSDGIIRVCDSNDDKTYAYNESGTYLGTED